jgi:hypothetical protein
MTNKRHRIGPENPLFRTGKTKDSNGYVQLSSKEWGEDTGKREHRAVMERMIGRKLRPDEIIHHINGIKSDNSETNLSLETRASHNRKHGKGALMVCAKCTTTKWYTPALIARMNSSHYMCRQCRYGKTWNNSPQR